MICLASTESLNQFFIFSVLLLYVSEKLFSCPQGLAGYLKVYPLPLPYLKWGREGFGRGVCPAKFLWIVRYYQHRLPGSLSVQKNSKSQQIYWRK